ncbi:MAG: carboxymuconolactone decarboxylase family protein [Candidatus Latescibacterota bacterium]|nr:carboxymuconolactone decarboxylase family protein [Candidatus Latescibacterota bacterium]
MSDRLPAAYTDFTTRYPKLAEAWGLIAEQGQEGPLDERTCRLVKLGIAMGAMRTGAVHSGVRKALSLGVTAAELEQVVALTAGTLGMPSSVANFTWLQDVLEESQGI